VTNSAIMGKAEELYQILAGQGVSVLMDDRDERAGVKFKDAELIGIPCQVVIGKEFAAKGNLEFKNRRTGAKVVDAQDAVLKLVAESCLGK
jgi:prolyl-tRNA synthetase